MTAWTATSWAITPPTTCCATPAGPSTCTRSGGASPSSRRASAGGRAPSPRFRCTPIGCSPRPPRIERADRPAASGYGHGETRHDSGRGAGQRLAWLYALPNPHPDRAIEAVELRPGSERCAVYGIAATALADHPLRPGTRRKAPPRPAAGSRVRRRRPPPRPGARPRHDHLRAARARLRPCRLDRRRRRARPEPAAGGLHHARAGRVRRPPGRPPLRRRPPVRRARPGSGAAGGGRGRAAGDDPRRGARRLAAGGGAAPPARRGRRIPAAQGQPPHSQRQLVRRQLRRVRQRRQPIRLRAGRVRGGPAARRGLRGDHARLRGAAAARPRDGRGGHQRTGVRAGSGAALA